MKIKRHSKIIELIENNDIETQEELAERLRDAGFDVTQATVSRDIRNLKLMKVPSADGRQRYAFAAPGDGFVTDKLISVFRSGVVSLDFANNMVVIKTLSGLAMGVAASLDKMGCSEVMGTIAGDDAIFCVTRSEATATSLVKKLNAVLEG
ncbi:MAG: arginine repressor [Defluviitaleaceae bacterium]|nr:arginine repressor [Defluviitaleaceae bacterium]